MEKQKEKIERGARRNCTEGISGEYQIYLNAKKQQYNKGRFSAERCKPFFKLLRGRYSESGEASEEE